MEVILFGRGSESLLADFDLAGVAYERWIPRPWQILNAGFWARIADGGSWPKLAEVMAAWVQAGGSRKISLTQKDNKIINIAGMSTEEVATMLQSCKNIMAIERQTAEK